jgi:hypothetical protein
VQGASCLWVLLLLLRWRAVLRWWLPGRQSCCCHDPSAQPEHTACNRKQRFKCYCDANQEQEGNDDNVSQQQLQGYVMEAANKTGLQNALAAAAVQLLPSLRPHY